MSVNVTISRSPLSRDRHKAFSGRAERSAKGSWADEDREPRPRPARSQVLGSRHPFSREWEKRATALKASALNKRSSRVAPAPARRRDRVPRRFLQAPVRSELAEAPNASPTATAQEGSRLRSPSLPTQFFTTPESESAAYWGWVKNVKGSSASGGAAGLGAGASVLPMGACVGSGLATVSGAIVLAGFTICSGWL